MIAGAVVGESVPSFFLGLALIYVFALTLHLPSTSARGGVAHVVLPTLTLAGYTPDGWPGWSAQA